MKVTLEVVEKVAQLSKIALNEEDKIKYSNEISQILDYVEKINELDTSQVEPTAHILDIHNVYREDKSGRSIDVEILMKLAPKHKDQFIVVPKVL